MRRSRRFRGAVLVLVVMGAGPAALGQQNIPVSTTVVGGTRTLTLLSPSGGSLDSISLGTSGSSPFIGNVTDLAYSRAGYQVSAALSDLYSYDGASYDCGKKIPSSSFGLEFLVDPTSVVDVAALTQPVWDLSGSITGALATTLGVPSGTAIAAVGVQGEAVERALAGAFTGIEDALPIKVQAGSGGAFSNPAPHSCDADATGATARSIMDGSVSSAADMLGWVTTAVEDAADLNDNGVITAAELVNAGEVLNGTMAPAVRQALIDAGVNATTLDSLIALGSLDLGTVYALLTATLQPVLDVLGQTGTYIALPKLVSAVGSGTAPGTYRGTLVVTMVDL